MKKGSPVEINFLWNVTVCSLTGSYKRFGGIKCLCLQGRKFLFSFSVHVPDYFFHAFWKTAISIGRSENLGFTRVSCDYFKRWPVCNELLL